MAKKQSPASQSTDSMIVWGQILLVYFRLEMSNIISSLENMYSMVIGSVHLSFGRGKDVLNHGGEGGEQKSLRWFLGQSNPRYHIDNN